MKKKIILITTIIFFLDQLIKLVISSFLHLNQSLSIIPNFFNITYYRICTLFYNLLRLDEEE